MASQHTAALGAGAVHMGAAFAVNVCMGLIQVLSMALEEDDELEDQTKAE
jgi:hypothetical protein